MNRSITITPYVTSSYVLRYGDGYRMRIDASNAVGLDEHIFLFLVQPLVPGQTTPTAMFQKICSPRDLVQYPVGDPLADSNPAWFRANSFTVDFDTAAEVDDTINYTYIQVQELLNAMADNDSLTTLGPIVISSGS